MTESALKHTIEGYWVRSTNISVSKKSLAYFELLAPTLFVPKRHQLAPLHFTVAQEITEQEITGNITFGARNQVEKASHTD